MDYLNKIVCGNCIDVMKNIEDRSIAVCITDPPYNYEIIGQTWDSDEIKRRTSRIKDNSFTLVKNIPYGSGLSGGVRNENWYKKNRNNILEYSKWVEEWGKELYRILKQGGLMFIFNSTRTIAHIQVALENVGFYARDIIVWRRHSGIPKGLNVSKKLSKMGVEDYDKWDGWHSCLRNEWEGIVVVQKPLQNSYIETLKEYKVGLFNVKNELGFKSNIIENIKRDVLDDYNTHCTVKPKELIRQLINLSVPPLKENIIIDPFMGSGTTGVVATELGINFIGIEINQDYVDIGNRRIKEAKLNNG